MNWKQINRLVREMDADKSFRGLVDVPYLPGHFGDENSFAPFHAKRGEAPTPLRRNNALKLPRIRNLRGTGGSQIDSVRQESLLQGRISLDNVIRTSFEPPVVFELGRPKNSLRLGRLDHVRYHPVGVSVHYP